MYLKSVIIFTESSLSKVDFESCSLTLYSMIIKSPSVTPYIIEVLIPSDSPVITLTSISSSNNDFFT